MKTNSIYEALGNVDDKLVIEAAAARRKRPVALIVVAAAAAMLMIVGFSENVGNGQNTLVIGDNEAALSFDLRVKDIKIPEKYYSEVDWSDEPQPEFYGWQMEMSPSDLTAEFGLEPLGIHNENFSEEIEFEPNHVWDENGKLLGIYNGEPQLYVNYNSVEFNYYLQSKSLGRNVHFEARYITDDDYSSKGSIGIGEGSLYKIIKLNNRAECYVSPNNAIFSFDGVYYSIGIDDYTKEGGGEKSLDDMMQILRDLGVL